MNLRQIEVFHAVYSLGSISGASRMLHVSQPSVSKMVKHAESRLGFALFRLVRGRLTPTDEAHILFREADDLHARIDTFQRAALSLRSNSEGHIRMGVLPSLALSLAPEAVVRFRQRMPRVTFEMSAVHHEDFRDVLASRACDFVIGHQLPLDVEIASASLGIGRVGALFLRRLLPEGTMAVTPEMLAANEVIGLSPSVAIGGLAGSTRAAEITPKITVGSVYIAAALARQGAGIAIVDEFTAREYVDDSLIFLPLAPAVTFELKVLHLGSRPLSRLARSFIELKRRLIATPTERGYVGTGDRAGAVTH
ncbi:LysR family transcriptional regulator [Sphingomonas montana]|uniref:LysR family transcriptional regulator n=1 Tax=Sphingomonas montana TaxID=1843236 RepID=UPI00096CDA42|nr:LysR family transcriptional regulator [Sphingomonas montana]